MTSMPGGAADKAGNRYEHLWTSYRVSDLLEGSASRLRLEPPGIAGQGVEFEIDDGDGTWAEQVKGSLSGRSWTIRRLDSEGVLASALVQVQAGRQFRFVAALRAAELETLSKRSRETSSLEEFKEALPKNLEPEVDVLVDKWAVPAIEAWSCLKSIHVVTVSPEALERMVIPIFKHLVASDPSAVLDTVRGFCDANLHKNLTGPLVWAHLEDRGFQRRHLAGDAGSAADLHQTVVRQSRRVRGVAPAIGYVASSNAARVLDALRDLEGKQVLLIDGRAGLGKSTVAAEVAGTLEDEGWFVAVARMDLLDETATTSSQVGERIGLRAGSPGVVLGGVANGQAALLVIDQLDAVSLYSGRFPDVFDAVDEILDEVATTENVKVMLVVRSVDLEADPRLKRLGRQDRAARITIDRLTEDDVRVKLEEGSVAVPESPVTFTLLRTPLHLSIFLRLSEDAQRDEYPSLQDLYARYTEELRMTISHEVGHLDWTGITSALVDYMNDHEQLTAPIAALDLAAPEEWHALESAAVLAREGNSIAFFHESYFDFLFARAFVTMGRSLHEFLVGSGQHLFRRAQTRQVLEHLLATDRSQFRTTVAELASSADIRSHIKAIVVEVFGSTEPEAADWLAAEETAWANQPTSWRLLGLLNRPVWFDIADAMGRWEVWLRDLNKVDRAFNQLVLAARTRPGRVVELVRPFIGASEDWRLRLKALVEWSLRPESVDLAIDLLDRGGLDDARGPIASNSDFWSIVYGLAEEDTAAAARLVGAYLNRGLAVAHALGSEDPFETGQLPGRSPSGDVIYRIATSEPAAYLKAVLPFVKTVAVANQYHAAGRLPVGRRWRLRYIGTAYSVGDKIFDAADQALRTLAQDSPDQCEEFLADLLGSESEELRFLACRALTTAGPADTAIRWLISDERNFTLGWADSARWASIELIRRWSGRCSDEVLDELERAVLAYQPSWEPEPQGRGRYALLGAIEETRLGADARRERDELATRFAPAVVPLPRPIRAQGVGSPIGDSDAQEMSDDEWFEALRTYSGETTWDGDRPVGGAAELAQVLGTRAEHEPERFARLALGFDASIPSHAFENVIRAVATRVGPELLADLGEHSVEIHRADLGQAICSVASRVNPMTDRLVALVASFVDDADPDREWARTNASSGQEYFGGDLDSAGLNSTRGQVASASATALFQSGGHLDVLRPVVERLAGDQILGVRAHAAGAVLALMNHEAERAYAAAETLFDTSDDIFNSQYTMRLLMYLIIRQPERFGAQLLRALNAEDDIACRAGHVWAGAAIRHGLPSAVPADFADLSQAARRGAAEAFAEYPGASAEYLASSFSDEDREVRKAAATAMLQLEDTTDFTAESLIESFLASAAFNESYDQLVGALPDLSQVGPELALRVCERAVELAGAELGDIRTARGTMGQPVMRVVMAVYRQGDTAVRARCLDVIDRLSERDAHGWRDLIEDER